MKEVALIAMTASGCAPLIVRAICYRAASRLFFRIRNEVLYKEEYISFLYMIIFSTDDGVPLGHTQWRLWRALIARNRLFEITDMRRWVAWIARLDTRGYPGAVASTTRTIFRTDCWGLGAWATGHDFDELAGGA